MWNDWKYLWDKNFNKALQKKNILFFYYVNVTVNKRHAFYDFDSLMVPISLCQWLQLAPEEAWVAGIDRSFIT